MDTLSKTFAENLMYYRTQRGKKQKDLAMVLDVSAATVSSWESGAYSPKLSTLCKISAYLDVPVERLHIRLCIARSKRPLIKDKNDDELMAFIVEQLEKRAPHYSKAQYSFRADKLEDTVQVKASVEAFRRQFGV